MLNLLKKAQKEVAGQLFQLSGNLRQQTGQKAYTTAYGIALSTFPYYFRY